ncbi:MAG: tetratricopeptide repeat protein [Proteobacteria bacterium]|nr:tetratricopeptide repeat protein [Pseudomonadota bacterium]
MNDHRYNQGLLLAIGGLIGLTLICYWQVSGFGFVFDDDSYILKNYRIHSGLSWDNLIWAFSTPHASNWHPLTWLSHMFDIQLFGLDAGEHHLINLLFHLINTILLLFLLTGMTRQPWPSFIVAALFALHPLHVESVAWISERKDVLSTLFWLLTMRSYFFYTRSPSPGRYAMVLFFFSLGLMTKPMLVTLPFALLLVDFWPLGRLPYENKKVSNPAALIWRLILEKLPLFFLSALSSMITYMAQKQGGAVAQLESLPFLVRLANALTSYVAYAWKMILPTGLAPYYPYPDHISWWSTGLAAALLLAVTIMAVRLRPHYPYLAIGWFWYLGTLLPVIGLVQVGNQSMADRYTYVPLIGLFIVLAWGSFAVMNRYGLPTVLYIAVWSVVLLGFSMITYKQAGYWRNEFLLWQRAQEITEENWLVEHNMGAALVKLGRYQAAIPYFEKALRMYPDFDKALANLGLALIKTGQIGEGTLYLERARRLNPYDAMLRNELGMALVRNGRLRQGIGQLESALVLEPDYAEARANLKMARNILEDTQKAITELRAVLRTDRENVKANFDLGLALLALDQPVEAEIYFKAILESEKVNADDAVGFGLTLAKADRIKTAYPFFQLALRLRPDDPRIQKYLRLAEGYLEKAGHSKAAGEATR